MALHQWHTLHISPLHPVFNFPPSTANLQIPLFLKGHTNPLKNVRDWKSPYKNKAGINKYVLFSLSQIQSLQKFFEDTKNNPLVELMSRLYII